MVVKPLKKRFINWSSNLGGGKVKCMLISCLKKVLRPKILYCVKFGDQSEVGLPCFALVIFEEP